MATYAVYKGVPIPVGNGQDASANIYFPCDNDCIVDLNKEYTVIVKIKDKAETAVMVPGWLAGTGDQKGHENIAYCRVTSGSFEDASIIEQWIKAQRWSGEKVILIPAGEKPCKEYAGDELSEGDQLMDDVDGKLNIGF